VGPKAGHISKQFALEAKFTSTPLHSRQTLTVSFKEHFQGILIQSWLVLNQSIYFGSILTNSANGSSISFRSILLSLPSIKFWNSSLPTFWSRINRSSSLINHGVMIDFGKPKFLDKSSVSRPAQFHWPMAMAWNVKLSGQPLLQSFQPQQIALRVMWNIAFIVQNVSWGPKQD